MASTPIRLCTEVGTKSPGRQRLKISAAGRAAWAQYPYHAQKRSPKSICAPSKSSRVPATGSPSEGRVRAATSAVLHLWLNEGRTEVDEKSTLYSMPHHHLLGQVKKYAIDTMCYLQRQPSAHHPP